MKVMSPRVVLGSINPDGTPPLPQSLGVVPVWSERHERAVGACPAWEFTHAPTGRLVVVQRVALVTLPGGAAGALYVAWVPADLRDGDNAMFEALASVLTSLGVLVAHWPCVDVGGDLLCPALDADATPAADVARVAWPASWRLWAEGDELGDIFATPPVLRGMPTGARAILETLA